jgi:hypothetical protein
MSNLYTYFAAPTDTEAAAIADSVGGPVVGVHPIVDGVDPVVQGATLLSLIDGRDYENIVEDPEWARLVSSPAKNQEAWVVSMPDGFTTGLAEASEADLAKVADPWSKTEEFWGRATAEDLFPLLLELRALALSVRGTNARLYCWISL